MHPPEFWNQRGIGKLPGHLGMVVNAVAAGELRAFIAVQAHHLAPNGFLHAGTLVTLADTCCGYGCVNSLPAGASGFTTVELKSNFLGTTLDGHIECVAQRRAPGQDHAGLGRGGHAPRKRPHAGAVPLHADGAVPQGGWLSSAPWSGCSIRAAAGER